MLLLLPGLIDSKGGGFDIFSVDAWDGVIDFDDSFLAFFVHVIII